MRISCYPKTLATIAALALLLVLPAQATDTNVLFNFDTVFGANSTAPSGSGPWLTASFTDTTGGVLLTLSCVNLSGAEKVDAAYFNLNPSLNVANLTFSLQSQSGSFTALAPSKGEDAFKAPGDGSYDFLLGFDTSTGGAFNDHDSVTYLIGGISGLSATDFACLSTCANGNSAGPYYAAVHLLGTGNGNKSASLEPDAGPVYQIAVPEPGVAALAGLAVGTWCAARCARRHPRQ